MRYRRFRTKDGQLTASLFTSSGEYIGAEDAKTAEAVALIHIADMTALYGQPVEIVDGDTDPWDGESALLQPNLTPEPAPLTLEERIAALEAKV